MTYDPIDTNDDGVVDADVDNQSVSTEKARTGRLFGHQVSGGGSGDLGMNVMSSSPELHFKFIENNVVAGEFDPSIYHKDHFDDDLYRVTVTNADNDGTDLYTTEDFQSFSLVKEYIFERSGEVNRIDDHAILPNGDFVIYEATDNSVSNVWTSDGADLTTLDKEGQIASSPLDAGIIVGPDGLVHSFSEGDANGPHGTSYQLEHRTTPVDDLTNTTSPETVLDTSDRGWGLGDADVIQLGGTYYMAIDHLPDVADTPYRVAIAQSDDLYNWTITNDKITPINGGDPTLTKKGGKLICLTEQSGGGQSGIAKWEVTPSKPMPAVSTPTRSVEFTYQGRGLHGWNVIDNGGSAIVGGGKARLDSGASSGNYATRYRKVLDGWDNTTWSERRRLHAKVEFHTTEGPMYLVTGGVGASNKTLSHMGWRVNNGQLEATVSDGSSRGGTVILGSSNFSAGKYELDIDYYPTDRVEFSVNANRFTASLSAGSNPVPQHGSTTRAERFVSALAEYSGSAEQSMSIYELRVEQAPGWH